MQLRDLSARYCGTRWAAIRLGLSETSVRLLADSGRIRSVRDPARRRLLVRKDVERLARDRQAQDQRESSAVS